MDVIFDADPGVKRVEFHGIPFFAITHRADVETERNTLLRQLASAEEGERRRLARELHDQLGQHLTAFVLGLGAVRRALAEGALRDAEARITPIQIGIRCAPRLFHPAATHPWRPRCRSEATGRSR